ncbi:hypothetical protein Cgig2_029000 [Carnegiea gigantea]|uniref:Uncharacterized protein n=1 Tax=Carnegiea gigantea TaxID=171969 RepID=A0A9Q1JH87_9CARY|nr:hypothetical protein Cgig2_029000 [Carnegiea gigantea]
MADTIAHQVCEQVKRALEVVGSAKPLPPLEYPLVHEGEPSTGRNGCCPFAPRTVAVRSHGQIGAIGTLPSGKRACGGGTRRSIRAEDNRKHELTPPPTRDEECSTEVVAIVAGGYVEEVTRSAWKAQLRSAQQVLTIVMAQQLRSRYGRTMKREHPFINYETKHNSLHPRPEMKTNITKIVGRGLQTKTEWGDGDYTSGSPPSSCSSPSDAPALASKGLVVSSPAASPSDEGGINSTSSGSRPSTAARSHSSTKHRPLGPPATSHNVFGSGRRAPLAAGTPQQPSPPGQRPQPWLSPPRIPLGSPRRQGLPSPRT